MKRDNIMFASVFKLDTITTTKWVATVITLGGAICTALMIDPLNIILLNIGSFLFLIWGSMIRDRAMMTVNGGLLFVYFIGMIVRL
jgi:hypothetical protein